LAEGGTATSPVVVVVDVVTHAKWIQGLKPISDIPEPECLRPEEFSDSMKRMHISV
jgi:hypothetical protein